MLIVWVNAYLNLIAGGTQKSQTHHHITHPDSWVGGWILSRDNALCRKLKSGRRVVSTSQTASQPLSTGRDVSWSGSTDTAMPLHNPAKAYYRRMIIKSWVLSVFLYLSLSTIMIIATLFTTTVTVVVAAREVKLDRDSAALPPMDRRYHDD